MTGTLAAYQAAIMADFKYQEGPNNATKFGRWYGDKVGSTAFYNAAWCDMSTCYWGDKAGAADIIGLFAWTPSHAQWFLNQGRWSWTPVPGGVAFWDWAGTDRISAIDHVSALIESVDGNGQAVTLDGNYADRVDRWRHPMRNFVGCGLPPWSTAAYRPPIDVAWDGHSFPGSDKFGAGKSGPWITFLGQQMFRLGLGGHYSVGPSPVWGLADQAAYAHWQRFCGYSGADADGIPGQASWDRMLNAPDNAVPQANQPPPPPPRPVERVPMTQAYQGNVYLGKLKRGQQDSDSVRVFQRALRNYPDISTIPLNPSGVTGNYGSETEAMCRKVYTTFAQWQPSASWGDGDLGVPGPALLAKLGCRIVG